MSDYSQGKIYKVTCESGLVYIGSTVKTLKQRFTKHTASSNTCETKHFINPKIELIENFPCETKHQLLWKEREWFEKTDCVNKQRPIATSEEGRELNKEYTKKYRIENKDTINEKRTEKFNCECGGRFTRPSRSQHKKTKLHKDYLAGLMTNI